MVTVTAYLSFFGASKKRDFFLGFSIVDAWVNTRTKSTRKVV